MRVIPFEVRDSEIDALVAYGLLDPVARNERHAIARALGKLMDQLPPEWWNVPPARARLASLNLSPGFIDHLVTLGWLPAATPRDRATIKAGLVAFTERARILSQQRPALFRAHRNATGGRPR
jgi:hypothetical protein